MEYNIQETEIYWQKEWAKAKVFEAKLDSKKPKFYCLEMFPYPSGNMHMGHVRNYSIGDSMARFQRLMGKNVLYPMGYDSFGMPAENAAKKEQGHPHNVTHRNIASIRADQERMGYSYDWNRSLTTSDVEYYRWNQEIFLMLNEKGLVERRFAPVNWCNDCDTVLANEQVKNNRCWRCGLEVIQKDMAQWFLRMTDYSDQLLDELDNIVFPENVKSMQRNWIGRSKGVNIDFSIVGSNSIIEVFTTRPDTIFGSTFVTLSPEHPLCEEICKNTDWHAGWEKLRDECSKMSEFERINMLKDKKGVQELFLKHNDISGVIHFAASKAVGESVVKPLEYYENNLVPLINLLQEAEKINRSFSFIFSSSCTVYGQADQLPITEEAPIKKAESPYGNTKQIGEEILWDTVQSNDNLNVVALRYFNPIGAHESLEIGELPIGKPQNLIPFLTQTAAGIYDKLNVFGNNYPTLDGTCIRDYIHVVDLAKAHVVALKRLKEEKQNESFEIFNLGTGKGSSVLEVIKTFERVSGKKLNYEITARRDGDIVEAYADTSKANNVLGWKATLSLAQGIKSAWDWEKKLRNKS